MGIGEKYLVAERGFYGGGDYFSNRTGMNMLKCQ